MVNFNFNIKNYPRLLTPCRNRKHQRGLQLHAVWR